MRADVGQSRFFKDQTYHFQTLRALSEEPYGGADTTKVLETISHIRAGIPRAGIKPGLLLPSGLWLLPSRPRTLKAEAERSSGPIPTFESPNSCSLRRIPNGASRLRRTYRLFTMALLP